MGQCPAWKLRNGHVFYCVRSAGHAGKHIDDHGRERGPWEEEPFKYHGRPTPEGTR